MPKESSSLLIAVVLAVAVVGGLWYFSTQLEPRRPPPPVVESPDSSESEPVTQGPQHPLQVRDDVERPALRPLPDLSDSDEYFKLELSDLFGPALSPVLAETRIIERIVATVDNLPRKHVAEQARPISGLAEPFAVLPGERPNEYILDPAGYRRYDGLVQMIASADLASTVDLYRRYYPLIQQAYEDLGYPDGYFNDRLVEVIDHLQEAPRPSPPVMLKRTHVLYEFADPALEQLSSGQKLLLRMGPANAESVQDKLAELRSLITEP